MFNGRNVGLLVPSGVRIRFFAAAREAVGASSQVWPAPAQGVATRALVGQLVERYPRLAPVARHSRFVHNGEYVVNLSEVIRPGDEFAIHPPYSGG